MMLKKMMAVILCALLLLPCAALGEAEEPILNLFTWELYVDDETIAQFEQATGIKVNYTNFNSNEEMLVKLEGLGGGEYDVIIASDYILNTARKEGLLHKLDKSLLPNDENIDTAYLAQYFDETDEYTAPYIVGTPLIVYDPNQVDFEITSYNDLWDERLRDSVVVMDDARNIIGITLKTMGQSFNVTDDAVLAQAEEKLAALRPNIRAFNSDTAHLDLLSGECAAIYTYTSYVIMALDENPELKVAFPSEGLGIGIDAMVIPAHAPHVDNAHKFINFILDGAVGKQVAEAQLFVTPNRVSRELLSADTLSNPALYIDPSKLVGAEFIRDLDKEYEEKYQNIWSSFKLK